MKEEEAKKKWCPMVRFHVIETSSQTVYSNRDEDSLSSRCIASDCMMWRWGNPEEIEIDRGYGQPPDIDFVSSGFCGLGGKP